jgi:hypothetical protein
MAIDAGDGAMATSDVLAGRCWLVESIGGTTMISGTDVTLEFGHDGRVYGSTGVNQYTASYAVAGDSVTFGPLAMTRRAGTGDATEQEHVVVGSVAGRCPFWFEGEVLVFDGPLGVVRCAPVATGQAEPVDDSAEG